MKSGDFFYCKRHIFASFGPFSSKVGWGQASRAEINRFRKSRETLIGMTYRR